MKPAIWCVATLVTSPVFVLGLLFECAAGWFVLGLLFECAADWFEIGRDAGADWIDEEPTP